MTDPYETISELCRCVEALAKMLRRTDADVLEPLRRDGLTFASVSLETVQTCERIAKAGWDEVAEADRKGIHI